MINSLTLSNFLSFQFQTEFQFKRFNLITGLNNSGKSNLCKSIVTLILSQHSLCSHRTLSVSDFQSLLYDSNRPLNLTLKSHLSVNRFLGHSNFNQVPHQDWSDLQGLNLHFGLLQANPVSGHDIVIADKPESGLHPFLQHSLISDLFSDPFIPGQWFIETHSQHVFNAFRILIKRGIIQPKDFNILHLSPDPIFISLDSKGHVDEWPSFFFDQDDNDFMELASLS